MNCTNTLLDNNNSYRYKIDLQLQLDLLLFEHGYSTSSYTETSYRRSESFRASHVTIHSDKKSSCLYHENVSYIPTEYIWVR